MNNKNLYFNCFKNKQVKLILLRTKRNLMMMQVITNKYMQT
jgi:hypothetical protein